MRETILGILFDIFLMESILLLLLLDRYLYTNGVCILWWWCSAPYIESKLTLDSVPIWLIMLRCTLYRCPIPGVFHFIPPPLLFHTILLRLFRRWLIPCPWHINARLFPPHHPLPFPLCPIFCLTEVQKRSRSNVLCNRVMPSPNVRIHCLKPRLRPHYLRRVLLPLPILPPLWDPPRQLPHHLFLETPQYQVHTEVNHPRWNIAWN